MIEQRKKYGTVQLGRSQLPGRLADVAGTRSGLSSRRTACPRSDEGFLGVVPGQESARVLQTNLTSLPSRAAQPRYDTKTYRPLLSLLLTPLLADTRALQSVACVTLPRSLRP